MQLTFKRQIRFLGQERKVGESLDVEIGPKVGQITEQALRALVNSGTLEADGMKAEAAAGGIVMHLRAKLEAQEEKHKKLASSHAALQQSHDDLEARVAKLEGGSAPAKVKSKREARQPAKE